MKPNIGLTALHAVGSAARPGPAEPAASFTYESYHGLREKAFSLSADPRFLFRSRAHELAFGELSTAIRRREGLVVLTGEIGTGKTTLCRAVLDQLDRRTFSAFVADPFVSREDLLKMLLIEFGVTSVADLTGGRLAGATRQELSYQLYDFLNALVPLQAFAVLVIDEAQNLSLPLMEEIRILADMEWREKLLQVVLVGQPELRSRLKLPQMRQVDQRVSVRCALPALGRSDAGAYVGHRLNVAAGGESGIRFSPGALDVVHHASAGVPRLINVICDRALHEAYALRVTKHIDSAIVWKAIGALGLDVTPAPAPADPGIGLVEVEPRAQRPEPRAQSPEPSAESPEPSAESPEPRAERAALDASPAQSPEPRAERSEPSAESPEPRVEPPALDVDVMAALDVDFMAAFRSESDGAAVEEHRAAGPGARLRRGVMIAMLGGLVAASAGGIVWYAGGAMADVAAAFAAGAGRPALPAPPSLPAVRGLTAPEPPATLGDAVAPGARSEGAGSEGAGATPPSGAPSSADLIEVALFQSGERASRLVGQLTAGGYPAFQREVTLGSAGRRFVQVLAGPYRTRPSAESALDAIQRIPGYADARIRPSSIQR